MNIDSLRGEIAALDAERDALHMTEEGELREFTPEEQERYDAIGAERASKLSLLQRHEDIAKAAQVPERTVTMDAPAVHVKRSAMEVVADRDSTPAAGPAS